MLQVLYFCKQKVGTFPRGIGSRVYETRNLDMSSNNKRYKKGYHRYTHELEMGNNNLRHQKNVVTAISCCPRASQ
jgi:hypothetical protein